MSIETYTTIMIYFFIGLFCVLSIIGIVCLCGKMLGHSTKNWWIIVYSICYSIFAMYNTFIPSIAYDDPADFYYAKFKDWQLHNFIFNDIKMFIIWLLIGVFIYCMLRKRLMKQ